MKTTAVIFLILLGFPPSLYCADTQEVIVCPQSKGRLSCPPSQVLNIKSANYGRTAADPSVCPSTLTDVTDCSAPNSLAQVRCACQDMEKCELIASEFLFGDPCVGTSKYLKVKFECVARVHSVKCGSSDPCVNGCPDNKTTPSIQFTGFVGRRNTSVRVGVINSAICVFHHTNRVINYCRGRITCDMSRTFRSNIFTCRPIFKFLQARLTCG